MFLEKYKHAFKSDDIYENNSLRDNPLFLLKDYYSEDYLNFKYKLDVSLISDFQKNLDILLNKYKFIDSYLENYINLLNYESLSLDQEYNEITGNISYKGEAFLNMFNISEQFNYVFDENIIYSRNIIDNGENYLKMDETMTEIPFYLDYINNNSFFITLSENNVVNELFIEFYNEMQFSIFGAKEDNTLENLYDKISSKEKKNFIIDFNNEYKRFYIISDSSITKYIKKIKVFSYLESSNNKIGYIIRKIPNSDKYTSFIFINDSSTFFYLYNQSEYLNVIKEISSNNKSSFINKNYLIEKNKKIENTYNTNTLYLLEVFNYNDNISTKTKIYGKEKSE